jgi:hypothetical protein
MIRTLAVVVLLALTACTRVIDAQPSAQLSVSPILEGQVHDLLSEEAQKQAVVGVGLYAGVEPAECAGLVQEANAPLIFDAKPAVNDGGFWSDGDVGIIEIAGVYRSNYDARSVIDGLRRTVDACQGKTLVSTGDDDSEPDNFTLSPPMDSGSPDIVEWSVVDVQNAWECDNAFVAAYNAAVFTTACSVLVTYDVLTLAQGSLDRINKLVNTVA